MAGQLTSGPFATFQVVPAKAFPSLLLPLVQSLMHNGFGPGTPQTAIP
jgi:hypothetical protein